MSIRATGQPSATAFQCLSSSFSMSTSSLAQLQQEDGVKQGQEDAKQQGLTTVNGIERRRQARGIPHAIAEMADGSSGGPHQVVGVTS